MTSPALRTPNEKKAPPAPNPRWILNVVLATLSGTVAAVATAFFLQKKDLALGFLSGGILSVFSFLSLRIMTRKVLEAGAGGSKRFWVWNLLRWTAFALLCWLLLSISSACLLGAMGVYFWFLVVLGWTGWKSSQDTKVDSKIR